MRGLVIFLLVLIGLVSFSFIAFNVDDKNNEKMEAKEQVKEFKFSTFTSAVCENKEEFVYCKDEVFVNCDGKISKAVEAAECNGFKVEAPKALGFAVFDKNWKDPRG